MNRTTNVDRGMCRENVSLIGFRMNGSLLEDELPRKVARGVEEEIHRRKSMEPHDVIVKEVKCIRNGTAQPSIDKLDSTSSTVSTSEEFSPTDDELSFHGSDRRPSLVLRKVREKIARRKSESSLELLDMSHRGIKFDLMEGCEQDSDLEDDVGVEPISEHDPSSVLSKAREKMTRRKSESSVDLDASHRGITFDLMEGLEEDSDLEDDVGVEPTSDSRPTEQDKTEGPISEEPTEITFPTSSPPRPLLSRIKSTPAVMQSASFPPFRRPSCLKSDASSRRRSLDSSYNCVHFGTINIREYQRSLVDNPAVTDGPPIGLSWKYDPHELLFRVDEYEDCKPTPRTKEEFCMPSHVREEMLLREWGHTLTDIRRVSKEARLIRQHRERNQRTSKATERVCELVESSKRKWHRLKTRTSKEMELEQLWRQVSETASL